MSETRTESLIAILDDISEFTFSLNTYYDDAEPQGVIDAVLSGKIDSLKTFFQLLGWLELATNLSEMIPLRGNAVENLDTLKMVIIPEARRLIELTNINSIHNQDESFWEIIHPRICSLARPRFEAGFFADAVESSFKEINDTVKRIVLFSTEREIDGAGLMNFAFSLQNPIIKLNSGNSETEKNIQQGYMQIMAGSMIGIRNPKAHSNLNPDRKRTLHLISLASLLMYKIDERVPDA